jgi:diketogulonate reductase-like aldo/keto reductase
MSDTVTTVQLSSGHLMPVLAYGTGTTWFGGNKDDIIVSCVKSALEAGYRHIDEAEMYKTEPSAGVAISEYMSSSGLAREELFVTSKILTSIADPEAGVQASLERLQLTYLDLYLIHAPFGEYDLAAAWQAMESLVEKGLVRSIGVSNFRTSDLEVICNGCKIRPCVNQIENNPLIVQPELFQYCKDRDIRICSYSPLAPIVHLGADAKANAQITPVLSRLASKYDKTEANILLKWNLQTDCAVVTTSTNIDRIAQSISLFDFELLPEEVEEVRAEGAKTPLRKYWAAEMALPMTERVAPDSKSRGLS